MGLDGAEEMLAEILVGEAVGIWYVARLYGAEIPRPRLQDIEQYVVATLNAARAKPDLMVSLKSRAYEHMKHAVLGRDEPSEATVRFIKSIENYIRDEYIHLAQQANEEYDEYLEEFSLTLSQNPLNGLYNMGPDPYDPLVNLKKGLAISGAAAALVATEGAILGNKYLSYQKIKQQVGGLEGVEGATKFSSRESLIDLGMNDLDIDDFLDEKKVKSSSKKAIRAIVRKAMKKMAAEPLKKAPLRVVLAVIKVSAKLARMVATKLLNAIPVLGTIIDAAINAIEQGAKMAEKAAIEEKLRNAEAVARATNWDLGRMLNTRQGEEILRLFYAKSTSTNSPIMPELPPPACRACLYAEKDYKGEGVCTTTAESDLRTNDFNNKARSLAIFSDKSCQSPSVVLHENQRHTGHREVLNKSVPDLSKVARGKCSGPFAITLKELSDEENCALNINWDKQVTSFSYNTEGDGVAACEVCLFENTDYKGASSCIDANVLDLADIGLNNRISSLRFNNAACKNLRIWAYENKDFKHHDRRGGFTIFSESSKNVGKKWNDEFSSIYFASNGKNTKLTKAKEGCRVCLYEHTHYSGDYLCLLAKENVKDLDKFSSGDFLYEFANEASSVDFITDLCNDDESLSLQLFSKTNYKGSKKILLKGTRNLKAFNDKASSAKVVVIPKISQPNEAKKEAVAWQKVSGLATDIAVGDDGRAWVIGKGNKKGGHPIYVRKNKKWVKLPGGATRITTAGKIPIVVQDNGNIYMAKPTLDGWIPIKGAPAAQDIAATAQEMWVTAKDGSIHRARKGKWQKLKGVAVRIAIQKNIPWVINKNGAIYRWGGKSWKKISGPAAIDISASITTGVWITGKDGNTYSYNGKHWVDANAKDMRAIAISMTGQPWMINNKNEIWTSKAALKQSPP